MMWLSLGIFGVFIVGVFLAFKYARKTGTLEEQKVALEDKLEKGEKRDEAWKEIDEVDNSHLTTAERYELLQKRRDNR